ncbi:hypothetical protein BGZ80_006358 [Entomortierella chlamydospora]|uniref:Integrase SAM-like N-terminal domain-containing protein n=1 Tax=Entomortierella chlamydospora TaxID=101097 RepID=A0A9P6MGY8_9FUNG|nr:hypothetical protein BGZ80_006358 [Entomortierella chlamydospora]
MDLMNFLDHGLEEKKWKLTTVHNYKSAVLQLLPVKQQQEIKEDDLFKEFTKVMGNSTHKRMHNNMMDLSPILKALQVLGDNHNMDIKDLMARHASSWPRIVDGNLELMVLFPKELRGGQRIIKPIVIKPHQVEAYCPVKAFVKYCCRT